MKWTLDSIQARLEILAKELPEALEEEQKAYSLYKTEEANLILKTINSGFKNQSGRDAEVKVQLEQTGMYREYHEKRLVKVKLSVEKELIEAFIKIEQVKKRYER